MRTNPFADALDFLLGATPGHAGLGWGQYIFVLLSTILVVGSLALAAVNWGRNPAQRTGRHVALWLSRSLIGGMWLEGSLWKLPLPVSGGFSYWLGQMGDNAAFAGYGAFIKSVLITNVKFVNPVIWLTETSLAAALLLGFAIRFAGLLGIAMSLNLWIGLYHLQAEWPWTYVFILLLHVLFIVDRAGRSLGLDALLNGKLPGTLARNKLLGRIYEVGS